MADGQCGSAPGAVHGNRWLTAVASLAVGAASFALWFWLLPRWLGFSVGWRAWRVGDRQERSRQCWGSRLRLDGARLAISKDKVVAVNRLGDVAISPSATATPAR